MTAEATVNLAAASPADAVARLVARLQPIGVEQIPLEQAAGRVLAEPVFADRDSPPMDVSAMDGYAVRLSDLSHRTLRVMGETAAGLKPAILEEGSALRIFTGACVPAGADAVIRREDTDESDNSSVTFAPGLEAREGDNIRRRGENGAKGETVLTAGGVIAGAVASALAAFGVAQPRVYRRVRVAVLVTGDELLPVQRTPEPWQIRDSNGPAVAAALSSARWIELIAVEPCRDEADHLRNAVSTALRSADALVITGGVSAGNYDYVPQSVRGAGATVLFHKLPIRPGKPCLGAVGRDGQLVLGLPGNPMSALCCLLRLGQPALRRLAGLASIEPWRASVRVTDGTGKTLPLWSYRPVRLQPDGTADLIRHRGSGDLMAMAQSDGVVEVPPNESPTAAPRPLFCWRLDD